MPTDFKLPAVERGWWKCAKCGRLFESYSNPPIWDEHACLHWEKNTSNAKAVGLADALSGQSHTSDGLCPGADDGEQK